MTKSTGNGLLFLTCQHSSSYSSKIIPQQVNLNFSPPVIPSEVVFFFLPFGGSKLSVTSGFQRPSLVGKHLLTQLKKSGIFNKSARSNNFQVGVSLFGGFPQQTHGFSY